MSFTTAPAVTVPAHALERGHSVTVDGRMLAGRWSDVRPFAPGVTVDAAVLFVSTVGAVSVITVITDGRPDQYVVDVWSTTMVTLTPGARLPGAAGFATPAQLAVDALDDQARLDDGFEVAESAGFDLGMAVDTYLVAKLWTQPDHDADGSTESGNLDDTYDVSDVSAAAREAVEATITDFVSLHPLAVRMYLDGGHADNGQRFDSAQFGHDFLLTRDGHGVGFWDRGMGVLGDYITALVEPYGDSDDLSLDAATGELV